MYKTTAPSENFTFYHTELMLTNYLTFTVCLLWVALTVCIAIQPKEAKFFVCFVFQINFTEFLSELFLLHLSYS